MPAMTTYPLSQRTYPLFVIATPALRRARISGYIFIGANRS